MQRVACAATIEVWVVVHESDVRWTGHFLTNEKNIRISLEYWMNYEVWGIRFDDIRSSWGADDIG